MSIDHVRYGRQIRLAEIGEAGQARLDASEVVPRAVGVARDIEMTYLKRAGAKVLDNPEANADATAHAAALATLGIRDSEARLVAEGALRALEAMRKILGISEVDRLTEDRLTEDRLTDGAGG